MLNDNPRVEKMVEKLFDLMACDEITNEWEGEFINDMDDQMKAGKPFSPGQVYKIEQLFERY